MKEEKCKNDLFAIIAADIKVRSVMNLINKNISKIQKLNFFPDLFTNILLSWKGRVKVEP